MTYTYQRNRTLESRQHESARMRKRYPNRIPVIMEKAPNANIPLLQQHKFLVPDTSTVSELLYILRKRIKLASHEALFLFIKDTLPSTSTTLQVLYHEHADPDGFLYITYANENTFG